MNAIKNIVPVFDFDGVVMHDAGGMNGSTLFRQIDIDITEEEFFDMYRNLGKSYFSCLEFTGARTPKEQKEWFDRVYFPMWREFSSSETVLGNAVVFSGADAALSDLGAAGAKPFIVSNNMIGYIRRALAKYGMGGRFAGIMSNGIRDDCLQKPETDLFRAAVMEYGIETEGKTVVVVGDSVSDYEFSRNLAAEGLDCRFVGTYYDESTKNDDILSLAQRIALCPSDIVAHIRAIAAERIK
ncbi:MAG: HAD family hydrolase [Rickettsiales bacterium]|jgi:phosphoglycolate phosphatase-like HAD superfamily hydrolase|nr:HAD family hydrolase [Rickettsiales bacterium]